MAELAFIQKEIELRQNLAGNKYTSPPLYGGKVYIMGELLYAKNFEEDNLYIFLESRLNEGWEYNTEDYQDPRITDTDESDLINRSRSITQISKAVPSGFNNKPVSYFSFPLAWNLLASDAGLQGEWPRILVQVNSTDSWDRHKILGYGFLEFPPKPGHYKISVPTCRPLEDMYSEVHSFYLGRSVRVEDPWVLANSGSFNEQGNKAPNNLYGVSTQSSGEVVFQLNVIMQTNAELLRQQPIIENINKKQKKQLMWRREQKKNQEILRREQQKRTFY